MKTHTWIMLVVAMGMLGTTTHQAHAQNTQLARFWLTETISGKTTGPIPAVAGTRFKTAHGDWIISAVEAGKILLSDAKTGKTYGPYGFQPQRIIMLGDKAMLFSKIENAAALPPPLRRQPLTDLPAPLPTRTAQTREDAPQGWDRKPPPSTNPGDHLNRPAPFSLEAREHPAAIEIWFEPLHSVKYDWSLGGYTGNQGKKLEASHIGASGTWRNFFIETSYINDAKISGSIVPEGTYLSDFTVDNGSGFSLAGGYVYSFVIDQNWNAGFGGFIQYERTTFDMNATVLTHGDTVIPPETDPAPEDDTITHSYAFKTDTSSLRMQETILGAFGGIDYATPVWGAGINLIINLYTDVNTSGSIEIIDDRHALSAKQTHPVGVAFSGWIAPVNDFFVTTRFMVGTEISIRLGIGKRF